MSAPDNSWEADIRYKIEQHEFEYDPQAWAAMEDLLNEAGGTPPTGTNGKGPIWGPTGLVLLLIGLAVALLYALRADRPQPELGSFSVTLPIETGLEEAAAPAKTVEVEPQPLQIQRETSTREPITNEFAELAPPAPTEEPNELVRPPVILLQPLNDEGGIPLLETPTWPTSFEWQPPMSTRRRRDKKTLFPDVIRNY